MPFGKFHIVAVFCPVVLSCLSSVLFDSSVQSVVVGLVVLLSCLLPVSFSRRFSLIRSRIACGKPTEFGFSDLDWTFSSIVCVIVSVSVFT